MSTRRTLATITPEDRSGAGAPKIYGYGRRWIERVSGRAVITVRQAIARGDFDPANPVDVVCWCVAARGRVDLADEIRALFSPNS